MLKKVLLITNIPTPYRIPLFNELNRQLEDCGIKLKVIFGAMGYARRIWGIDMSECQFDYQVLPTKKIRFSNPEMSSFTYSGLYQALSKENLSVVITNGFSIASTKLWLWSWFVKTPYMIWIGDIDRKNSPYSFLRRIQRKRIINRAVGFIVYGTKAKEYLVSLGADPNKVQVGINTVDTQFYRNVVIKLKENLISHNGKKHLLYIGHLSPRKNVLKLIEVIKGLSMKRSDFMLNIVGDGVDRDRLEKYVLNNKLVDFVKFHGFKQKSDLPQYMAQAECFLFQTDFDIWGLVLNEAMAAGLPCIASIHAGATHDLIENGVTGFAMNFSEKEKVAEKINWILENPELSKEIGQNASDFMSKHVSLEKSALGFVKAIMKLQKENY